MSTNTQLFRLQARKSKHESKKTSSIPPMRGLLPLVFILALWQLLGPDKSVYGPRPSTWVKAIKELFTDGVLLKALGETLTTFVISIIIAVIIGTLLGILVGRVKFFDRLFGPLFEFFRVLPPAAIVPLAVLIAGYSEQMKVGVVVLAAVWPILLQVRSEAKALDPILFEVGQVLHLKKPEVYRKVLFPAVIPAILQGLRLATPILLIIVLLVEILTRINGLGGQIQQATENYQSPVVYGLLIITGLLVIAVNLIVGVVENTVLRYRQS